MAQEQVETKTDINNITYGTRLRELRRRERNTIWVGGGVIALIALGGGDLGGQILRDVHRSFTGLFITFVLASGIALANSRMNAEWTATVIERDIDDGKIDKNDALPAKLRHSASADKSWIAALLFIISGGVVLLAATWRYVI